MLTLRLLGTLDLLDVRNRPITAVLRQPKRVALLAYLSVAAPDGFVRRDRLLALFWPETDTEHGRDALNTAVRFLRREIGTDTLLARGAEELGIAADTIQVDARSFRQLLAAGRPAEALALYTGELLDGFHCHASTEFTDWLEAERGALRREAAIAAHRSAELAESVESYTTAVMCARRAVELSLGDERIVRDLLQLLDRLGDRAGALHAYDTFAKRLAADFGADPSVETLDLVRAIRARTIGSGDAAGGEAKSPVAVLQGSAQISGVLAPPARVGFAPWEVLAELGRGGMSIVYLANDPKHNRRVALKTLRPELTLTILGERFLREISLTAQLVHPHILPLLDSGSRDGVIYYVTPYVSGDSLRTLLTSKGALPLADAVRVAREVASALVYAHRLGIVHRDIKPENILMVDGHALLADFGVARAFAAASTPSAALMTDPGAVIGSRAYMSPEQAIGDASVDVRSDVYSLGCVLFEMLTGHRPNGANPSDTIKLLGPEVPRSLADLVRRSIEWQPALRPETAAAFADALEVVPVGANAPRAGRRGASRWLSRLGVGGALAAMVGLALPLLKARTLPFAVERTAQITNDPGLELDPAISPDGRLIAYAAGPIHETRIFVKQVAGGPAVEISGQATGAHRAPSWSPDGSHIVFLTAGSAGANRPSRILMVPVLGGAVQVIADGVTFYSTPAWSPNGEQIAYPIGDSIVLHAVNGGDSYALPASGSPHSLAWSADGARLAFVLGNPAYAYDKRALGNILPNTIWTIAAARGAQAIRVSGQARIHASPLWTPGGRALLFLAGTTGSLDVYRQPIDGGGIAYGAEQRLTVGLSIHSMNLSHDGRQLAYSSLRLRSNIFSAAIGPGHDALHPTIRAITNANQIIETTDVSLDGRWLAFDSNRGGPSQIYKMSTAGGEAIQLTHDSTNHFAPAWSPDAKRLAFHAREGGTRAVFVMSANGGAPVRVSKPGIDASYARFSPDGKYLYYMRAPGPTVVVALTAEGVPVDSDTVISPPAGMAWNSNVQQFRGVAGWTNDLRYVVYRRGGTTVLRDMNGAERKLVDPAVVPGAVMKISFGRDPSVVYVRAIDSTEAHSFYAVPVSGERPRLLARIAVTREIPARPWFVTDDHKLYFTLIEAESDIWVMTIRNP